MLYQSQLMENQPYVAKTSTLSSFPLHIHHENEIIYALRGGIEIKVGGRLYSVDEGQVAQHRVVAEVHSLVHNVHLAIGHLGLELIFDFGQLILAYGLALQ